MRQVLFYIGSTPIWSHAVFVALGMVVAVTMSWRIARRRKRATPQFIWIISGGLIGAAILAKYGLVLRYLMDANSPSLQGFFAYGGRSLLGGLAGAYAGVVIVKRLIGYRDDTGDILCPGVALGIAIGRIGCHLAETPGTPTSLPWGVHVPAELTTVLRDCIGCRTGAPMHPSFLYETVFLALLSLWLYPRAVRNEYPAAWMRDGDLFKLFLLLYAAFRFFVEFVRGNPAMLFGLSGSQITTFIASLLLLIHFARRYTGAHTTTTPPILTTSP